MSSSDMRQVGSPQAAGEPRLEAAPAGPPPSPPFAEATSGPPSLAGGRAHALYEVARAQRHRRGLFARVQGQADDPPEVAVVSDISRTGVRLRLGSSARLNVVHAHHVSIELRLPAHACVRCEASLVRIVRYYPEGVELAFMFSDATSQDPRLLELLQELGDGGTDLVR